MTPGDNRAANCGVRRGGSRDAGASQTIHAVALVMGEAGILLRGRPGAGKTQLASALIAKAKRSGSFARLIGDDRVVMTLRGGRIVLQPHPGIAGLIERRWEGIVETEHEGAAVLRCAVNLVDSAGKQPARLPEEAATRFEWGNVFIPQLNLPDLLDLSVQVSRVLAFVARPGGGP